MKPPNQPKKPRAGQILPAAGRGAPKRIGEAPGVQKELCGGAKSPQISRKSPGRNKSCLTRGVKPPNQPKKPQAGQILPAAGREAPKSAEKARGGTKLACRGAPRPRISPKSPGRNKSYLRTGQTRQALIAPLICKQPGSLRAINTHRLITPAPKSLPSQHRPYEDRS